MRPRCRYTGCGFPDTVARLLAAGAAVDARDVTQCTPLQNAAHGTYSSLAQPCCVGSPDKKAGGRVSDPAGAASLTARQHESDLAQMRTAALCRRMHGRGSTRSVQTPSSTCNYAAAGARTPCCKLFLGCLVKPAPSPTACDHTCLTLGRHPFSSSNAVALAGEVLTASQQAAQTASGGIAPRADGLVPMRSGLAATCRNGDGGSKQVCNTSAASVMPCSRLH